MSRFETNNMREEINIEPFHQIAQDSLISGKPHSVGFIGNSRLLLLAIFNFKGLGWSSIRSIKQTEDLSTTKGWEDLSFPKQMVLAGEFLCRRRSKGGRKIRGGGSRRRRGHWLCVGCGASRRQTAAAGQRKNRSRFFLVLGFGFLDHDQMTIGEGFDLVFGLVVVFLAPGGVRRPERSLIVVVGSCTGQWRRRAAWVAERDS
jgi:hypothetical protein